VAHLCVATQRTEVDNLARKPLPAGRNRKANMAKKHHSKNTTTGAANGKTQTFSFAAPTAMSVQLVGDFTHWQQKAINMQKGADGIWRTTVELPPGGHHYRFLVDGQWRDDPECTLRVSNPFGAQNCVCQVA
jgi:1,4-alpha-glucan branching enzyme